MLDSWKSIGKNVYQFEFEIIIKPGNESVSRAAFAMLLIQTKRNETKRKTMILDTRHRKLIWSQHECVRVFLFFDISIFSLTSLVSFFWRIFVVFYYHLNDSILLYWHSTRHFITHFIVSLQLSFCVKWHRISARRASYRKLDGSCNELFYVHYQLHHRWSILMVQIWWAHRRKQCHHHRHRLRKVHRAPTHATFHCNWHIWHGISNTMIQVCMPLFMQGVI